MINHILKKGFAIWIITILLIISISQTVTAEFSSNEPSEVTTEFCGLGRKRSVLLSQQEIQEIHDLLESFRTQTNQATSQEEFTQLINNAINKLENYGLFGDINSNQIKQLIYRNQLTLENKICLLIGRTSETTFYGPVATLLNILYRKSLQSWIYNYLQSCF